MTNIILFVCSIAIIVIFIGLYLHWRPQTKIDTHPKLTDEEYNILRDNLKSGIWEVDQSNKSTVHNIKFHRASDPKLRVIYYYRCGGVGITINGADVYPFLTDSQIAEVRKLGRDIYDNHKAKVLASQQFEEIRRVKSYFSSNTSE